MSIKDIFVSCPKEPDTTIINEVYAHYEGIPVLIEKWFWDGITASSCIIPLHCLNDANKTKEEFIAILKDTLSIVSDTTEREVNGFFFLNFNFET